MNLGDCMRLTFVLIQKLGYSEGIMTKKCKGLMMPARTSSQNACRKD
jgi:hypothetical protein